MRPSVVVVLLACCVTLCLADRRRPESVDDQEDSRRHNRHHYHDDDDDDDDDDVSRHHERRISHLADFSRDSGNKHHYGKESEFRHLVDHHHHNRQQAESNQRKDGKPFKHNQHDGKSGGKHHHSGGGRNSYEIGRHEQKNSGNNRNRHQEFHSDQDVRWRGGNSEGGHSEGRSDREQRGQRGHGRGKRQGGAETTTDSPEQKVAFDDFGSAGQLPLAAQYQQVEDDLQRLEEEEESVLEEPPVSSDNAATMPPPPPHDQVAAMARYIVHVADWAAMATISTREPTTGMPFANVFSVSDGTRYRSTGIPYMYLTDLEMSVKDLRVNNNASLTMSLAQTDYCRQHSYDPEDPLCAHVILSGRVVQLDETDPQYRFARDALFSRHPEMSGWPLDHHWFIAKLDIQHVCVLDYFGGAKTVPLDQYYNTNPFTVELPHANQI